MQEQVNNVCGFVFDPGLLQTYCNTIIKVGFGSALTAVFNFVKSMIEGVIIGVNKIATGMGKIFSMTKFRLLGSVGDQKTSIGAEIDFEVWSTITNTYKPQPKWTGKLNLADATAAMNALSTTLYDEVVKVTPDLKEGAKQLKASIVATTSTASTYFNEAKSVVTSAMADGESCTWYSQSYGYWCRASNQYWDGGYASGEYKSASVLTREWTSQQGLSKASGYTPVNTKEIKCLDANPATTSWNPKTIADNKLDRAACMFYKVKKPAYPSTWPEDQKANFETLINKAWGGRRMRKSENAKLFENIRRIAAANVVEEWTARNAARQGQALREKVEGNVGQSLPVGTTNTTTNTAETPDL